MTFEPPRNREIGMSDGSSDRVHHPPFARKNRQPGFDATCSGLYDRLTYLLAPLLWTAHVIVAFMAAAC
jgi:hypothetical protein